MAFNKYLYALLNHGGYTSPAENIPSIFKYGCGLDSESTTITHIEQDMKKTKTIVDYCFNYAWQYSFEPEHAEIVRRKEDILQVIYDIIETVKCYNTEHETNAIYIIWCANLAHEWSFIKKEIAEHFEITRCFAKSPRDVLFIQLENCVEFRECIGLFGHSLDDIAKNWCSADNQKLTGKFDYNKIRHWCTPLDETEKPYMYHDVTTLSEMHINVIKKYTQSNGVCRLPYTSSGFVRMALKDSIRECDELTEERESYNFNHPNNKPLETNIEYLKKQNSKTVLNPLQWTVCREYGYSGGLCGSNINYAGKILKDVVCADLTSDYPAQLSHKKFPWGSLREMHWNLNDIKDELDRKHTPYFAVLKIRKMQAKTQHATFSKHKIINADGQFFNIHGTPKNLIIYNGKVFKGENLVVCWNDVDIAAYKELYDIDAGVLTLWAFDSYKRLPEWFLKTLWRGYEKKAILKNAGLSKTIDYTDAKRIPNSMYGVCATRVNDTFDAIDTAYNFKIGKEKTFDKIKKDFWLNPYIAFWCTSYARAILMHFLARFPDAIVQYDTDSLYYIKSKSAGLETALNKYNDDILKMNRRIFRNEENPPLFETLGQWDFDDVYKKFLGMGAKKYIKQAKDGHIETVIAGLPKGAIPKEIEERAINAPFDYYNPLIRYLKSGNNKIIIKHAFAHKFASVYGDEPETQFVTITDSDGMTMLQPVSTYHAIIPIDYTLLMSVDYIKHIIKGG